MAQKYDWTISAQNSSAFVIAKSPSHKPEALAVARAITDESARAQSLAALVPQLPDLLPEVLASVKDIVDEADRARTLETLAFHLTDPLRSMFTIANM